MVELADLFHATPARLKFLRTDRAETLAIADVVRRLAMAAPGVAFTLRDVTDPDARARSCGSTPRRGIFSAGCTGGSRR